MNRYKNAIVILILTAVTLGCGSRATVPFSQASAQQVDLSGDNYRVVRQNATGTSTGFSIFFIPFTRPSWIDAMNDLYSKTGLVLGRAHAPINVLDEVNSHNLILVSWETFRLRADIIEFIDE